MITTTTNAGLAVHVRWVCRPDLPAILDIEGASFPHPWEEEDFLLCMRQRNCIGMVAEVGREGEGRVVGYMIYELHKSKLHLLNFAVHPRFRRHGVGTRMVAKLVSKLSGHRRDRATLDISDANLGGHLFFRKRGFEAVRVRRDHYGDGLDSYRFCYRVRPGDEWGF